MLLRNKMMKCYFHVITDACIAETCDETVVVEAADDVTSLGSRCASQFGDGRCDRDCDTELTQFDGFDCASPPTAGASAECSDDVEASSKPVAASSRRTRCSQVYADGTCDADCDSAACLWDGGDCIGTALT